MRRIVLWAMSTLTVLVLLFSYNTSRSSSAAEVTAETRSATSSGQATAGSSSHTSSASSGSSAGSSSSSSASASTVTGDEVMTRYGVVQVEITVKDGRITSSTVLQVPWSDRHDQMINSRAVPVYNEEAVAAQSSDIDVVSGATVTWQGYTESLQSAIDQANL